MKRLIFNSEMNIVYNCKNENTFQDVLRMIMQLP